VGIHSASAVYSGGGLVWGVNCLAAETTTAVLYSSSSSHGGSSKHYTHTTHMTHRQHKAFSSHSVTQCHTFDLFQYDSETGQYRYYCKTLYFSCILIWQFWSAEILLHFNLAFSQVVLCKVKFQVTSHVNRIVHYR